MVVQVRCPNPACGKGLRLPAGHGGAAVRCKHCGQSFSLPAEGTQHPTPAAAKATAMGEGTGTLEAPGSTGNTIQAGPPSVAAPDATLPRQIGRFEVRARLGAGAFGAVYRAYDPQLDREVALKVPHATALDNPKRVERFLREARAAAQLRHPHIVPVFDAGRDGATYFIASAFIAGKTLAQALDNGPLPPRSAAAVACDLADALAHAHEQGIVHRDVKPANV